MIPSASLASDPTPRVSAMGVDGILVTFGHALTEASNRAALAFRAAIEAEKLKGVVESSTSLTSVYLRLDLGQVDHNRVRADLQARLASRNWYQTSLPQGRRLWRIPAVFGGELAPQLDDAAQLAGMTPEEAVASLCAAPLRVQAIGFAPGQPYLGELPSAWNIPRQTRLTERVPAGALVIAIRQMVLFSVSTPTGWRHVGQTALRLFRPDLPEPFLLRPSDEILFQPVTRELFEGLAKNDPRGGAVSERLG